MRTKHVGLGCAIAALALLVGSSCSQGDDAVDPPAGDAGFDGAESATAVVDANPDADASPSDPFAIATENALSSAYSAFGVYSESPESPDGKRLAFIEYLARPSRNVGTFFDLRVCDRDFTSCRTAYAERQDPTINHNGAFQQWVDDRTIAYSPYQKAANGTVTATVKVVDVDAPTGQELVRGPYANGFLGDNTFGGKILIGMFGANASMPEPGLYEVDVATGVVTQRVKNGDLTSQLGGNTTGWVYSHGKYSTDGSHIAFLVETSGGTHLFTCATANCTTGQAGFSLAYWGNDKPMHFLFYDADTLMGHDSEVADGQADDKTNRRWKLDRSIIETLAGPGNHNGVPADRAWIATDSWYQSDPTELFLYKRGETIPTTRFFTIADKTGWDEWEMVWTDLAHLNPSFSRDGTRLYYMRPTAKDRVGAFMVDLTKSVRGHLVAVAASSEAPSSPVTNATDENPATAWTSATADAGSVELDFGAARHVRWVGIDLPEGSADRSLHISLDAGAPHDVIAKTGMTNRFLLDEAGSKLRVAQADAAGPLSIAELAAYVRVR